MQRGKIDRREEGRRKERARIKQRKGEGKEKEGATEGAIKETDGRREKREAKERNGRVTDGGRGTKKTRKNKEK